MVVSLATQVFYEKGALRRRFTQFFFESECIIEDTATVRSRVGCILSTLIISASVVLSCAQPPTVTLFLYFFAQAFSEGHLDRLSAIVDWSHELTVSHLRNTIPATAFLPVRL